MDASSPSGERPAESESRPRPDLDKLLSLFRGPLDVRSISITGIFVLGIFYTLYFARALLLPIVLAMLFGFLLAPAVRGLRRLRIPAGVGAALVLGALLAVVGVGVVRLSGPAGDWLERAPQGMRRVEVRIRQLQRPVDEVRRAAAEVEEQVERIAGEEPESQQVEVQGESLTGLVLNRTRSFVAGAFVTLVLLYFLLASGGLFLRKLVRVLPRLEDKKAAIQIARATERHISAYLGVATLINAGLGIAVAVAMHLLGMPNPWLWGVMAGVLNFIPYLGPMVTLGVVAFVSLLTFDDLGRAAVAPAVYLALNAIESNFVTPTLLGRRLQLNPVVVFLGLMLWGWLWGIPGALLAVPIMGTLKIVCDHVEPLAPIGEFLGR